MKKLIDENFLLRFSFLTCKSVHASSFAFLEIRFKFYYAIYCNDIFLILISRLKYIGSDLSFPEIEGLMELMNTFFLNNYNCVSS